MSLYLTFSTWIKSDRDLLTVADRVATFATRQTRWSDPVGDSGHDYVLMGLNTPEGRQRGVSHKLDEAMAQIRAQMARGGVEALVLSIGGSWQDQYVINQEVYQNWGASLLVHQAIPGSSLFPVTFHFREASFWFATRENADIFFDKDHTVQENSRLGFEMKEAAVRPAWVPASYGAMYVAEEKISQKNRLRLASGLARLIRAFDSPAAALHYGVETRYDPMNQVLSVRPAKGSLMYYTGQDVRVEPPVPEQFVVREVDDIRLHLEPSHFPFL